MARLSKTRNMLEDFVKEGSFKWLVGSRSSLEEEVEVQDTENSVLGDKSWIPELSPGANIVVRRCSRILGVPISDLQNEFDSSASQSLKDPSQYARNLLEFCCFRALALSTHVPGHLADMKFRRLTFDMMLAWEAPTATSQPLLNLDEDATVGKESFHRIAPAVPIIANVVIVDNLFELLTTSSGGRLQYPTYEKYLIGLERAIKKLRTQSESSLLSAFRSDKSEKILEVDGTVTTQPVLQHVGISTWPGRLTLTDHALYFEPLRVVSYDKAKKYDLEEDLKQVVKPEMTGPWGTRLFDKAVSYKSTSVFKDAFQDPGSYFTVEPLFEKERYIITYNPTKGKVYALLKDRAKSDDVLKAAFHGHALLHSIHTSIFNKQASIRNNEEIDALCFPGTLMDMKLK